MPPDGWALVWFIQVVYNHGWAIGMRHPLLNNMLSAAEQENQMKCNVGKTDRIVRVILGVGIIAGGFCLKSWWGAIGLVPIITAAIGWCPAYIPFGISSCKK